MQGSVNPNKESFLPIAVRAMIAGFGLSYFGTGLILPVNAIYITTAPGSNAQVAAAFFMLLSVGGLAGGAAAGYFFDILGGRPVTAIGFGMQGLGWLFVPFVHEAYLLWAAAITAGIGTGIAATALRSQMSLTCPPEQRTRAFALRNATANLGVSCGAAGAAAIAALGHVNYKALYSLDAISFWIFGLVVWLYTAGEAVTKKTRGAKRGSLDASGAKFGLAAHFLVIIFALGLMENVIPLILRDSLRQSLSIVGLAVAFEAGSTFVLQLPIERLLRTTGALARFKIQTSLLLCAWGIGFAAAWADDPMRTWLIFIMIPLFSSAACIYQATFQPHLTALVPKTRIGAVSGLVSIVYNCAMILGSSGGILLVTRFSNANMIFGVLAAGAIVASVPLAHFAKARPVNIELSIPNRTRGRLFRRFAEACRADRSRDAPIG